MTGAHADRCGDPAAVRTSYPGADLHRIVEASEIQLLAGTSGCDLPRASMQLTGPPGSSAANAQVKIVRHS